jgi:2,5-diketo-D-gluconate reductase B
MNEFKIIKGVKVPSIGLGTYDLRAKSCETVLETALELGYRHIDTAQMYDNEKNIGNVLGKTAVKRDNLFITTKVWPTNYNKDKFFKSVEKSLKDLQLEQVDLLLLHWPADTATNIKATEYVNECQELKYAKHIGVSNFSLAQLRQAQKQTTIFCNQVPPESLREMPKDEDILLAAYSPMKNRNRAMDQKLEAIGKKYGKSAMQVLLRAYIQQPNVVTIPKASSVTHLKENLEVFDFKLNEEEMKVLTM